MPGSSTASCVARSPRSAVLAAAVLVALATAGAAASTHRSAGSDETAAQHRSDAAPTTRSTAAFPSEGSSEIVVDRGRRRQRSAGALAGSRRSRRQVQERTDLFEGKPTEEISDNGTVAIVSDPHRGQRNQRPRQSGDLDALRDEIVPATIGSVDGAEAYTTGPESRCDRATSTTRWSATCRWCSRSSSRLAFLLLLVTFRSIVIPLKAIVLNLLSVGAAYGLLVLVFQRHLGGVTARVRVERGDRSMAAALPVRDPVRALDGLPRVHPQPDPRVVRPRA